MPDMDCPKCGAYNETDVGSCLSCGASLPEQGSGSAPTLVAKSSSPKPASRLQASGAPPKQCPNCMTLNAATFKFCARCGTPLGATGAPDAGPQTPAPKAPAAAPRPAPAPAARPATAKAPAAGPKAPTNTGTKPRGARPAPPP